MIEQRLTGLFASCNRVLIDLAKLVSVWAADGVVAVLAAENMVNTLHFSAPVAILTGIALEGVGVVASASALRVHRYNQLRAAGQPRAPEVLAWIVAGLQFAVGCALIAVNAVFVNQMVLGLLSIGILSALGTLAHMLSEDVDARESPDLGKAQVALPQVALPFARQETPQPATTPARIVAAYRDNPHATQAEIAQAVGITRQAVSRHVLAMEHDGILTRHNGSGIIITQ